MRGRVGKSTNREAEKTRGGRTKKIRTTKKSKREKEYKIRSKGKKEKKNILKTWREKIT